MSDTKIRTVQRPAISSATAPFGPVNVNAKIESGNRAFLEKDFPNALRYYSEALSGAPQDTGLMNKVGLAYYKLRDFPQAVRMFQKALEIQPDDRDTWFSLGLVYAKSGDKANALKVYDTLKKLHPEKADSLYKVIYA
jgi:tetratricopeptide (TPR) repeat protein